MEDLIARYLYDVTRRIPEKERDEVERELRANIYDMLSEQPDEAEIRAVLNRLGPPSELSQKYNPKPRYLISPSVYEEYLRVLRVVLPVTGIVGLAAGLIAGVVGAAPQGAADMIAHVLSNGISFGFSVAFQALLWTTVGFVIADRAGKKPGGKREWKLEDLPEIPPQGRGRISLSDSIAGLVISVIFYAVAILACLGQLPVAYVIERGDIRVHSLFNPGFLSVLIPALAVMAVLTAAELMFKIRYRRWTPVVCAVTVLHSLADLCILLFLVNRPNLFSAEFISLLQNADWKNADVTRYFQNGWQSGAVAVLSGIFILICLAQCAGAVYKTYRKK